MVFPSLGRLASSFVFGHLTASLELAGIVTPTPSRSVIYFVLTVLCQNQAGGG